MGGNEPILGAQHCWKRGVWDEGMKPKPIETLIACDGAESYVTMTCIAGFSHSVLSFFDLHYQYLQKTTPQL